ncbi:hypothetical protein TNCT_611441 [Trichonephila clavata]|uniref:BPTI/Kunitz inhibitor domain-containing protein n=1 Tax=Trichonephila clavata TaxID=2740835 RepID=A0A8X6FRZ7_TRICU|nr:hypothetical protein TNCT_611441 [Trichonephila clavata]
MSFIWRHAFKTTLEKLEWVKAKAVVRAVSSANNLKFAYSFRLYFKVLLTKFQCKVRRMKLVILFVLLLPAVICRRKDRPAECDEPMDQGGSCSSYIPMFYYDPADMTCRLFIYKGCGGNYNKFKTKEDCLRECGEEDITPNWEEAECM